MAFTKIQLRRDTRLNYDMANPTLAQGELCLETDRKTIKIGDGVSTWNALPYFTGVEILSLSCYQEISSILDIQFNVELNTLNLTNLEIIRYDPGYYVLTFDDVGPYYQPIGLIQMLDREVGGSGYGKFLDISATSADANFRCTTATAPTDIDAAFQIVLFFVPTLSGGMLD